MTKPDVGRLIGEVAARHGIRLEPDDPAFALVTLNQLVFEQVVEEAVEEIRAATGRLDAVPKQNGRSPESAPAGHQSPVLDGGEAKKLSAAAEHCTQQIHQAGERALRMADEFGRRFRWTLLTVAGLCFVAGMVVGAASLWLVISK